MKPTNKQINPGALSLNFPRKWPGHWRRSEHLTIQYSEWRLESVLMVPLSQPRVTGVSLQHSLSCCIPCCPNILKCLLWTWGGGGVLGLNGSRPTSLASLRSRIGSGFCFLHTWLGSSLSFNSQKRQEGVVWSEEGPQPGSSWIYKSGDHWEGSLPCLPGWLGRDCGYQMTKSLPPVSLEGGLRV